MAVRTRTVHRVVAAAFVVAAVVSLVSGGAGAAQDSPFVVALGLLLVGSLMVLVVTGAVVLVQHYRPAAALPAPADGGAPRRPGGWPADAGPTSDPLTPLVRREHPRGLRGEAAPRPVEGGPVFRSVVATAGASVVLAAVAATPAAAAPQPKEVGLKSNGLGVCVSQLAISPEEILGLERLGQEVNELARSKMLLEAIKTVRSPECGYPPGPGHLP